MNGILLVAATSERGLMNDRESRVDV